MKKKSLSFRLLLWLFATPFLLFFQACEKEDSLGFNTLKNETDQIPYFSSTRVLYQYLSRVDTMSLDNLIIAENATRFCSFGRYSEELYNYILMKDSTIGVSSLADYVQTNHNYLKLFAETDTDYVFDTKLSACPFKYAINRDRLMQIGDTIYKFFEKGHICGNSAYLRQIKSISDSDFASLSPSDTGQIKVYKQTSDRQNLQYFEQSANSNKEKIETIIALYNLSPNYHYKEYRLYVQSKGKRKIGWTWWNVSRDLENSLQVEYYVNDVHHSIYFYYRRNQTKKIQSQTSLYTYFLSDPCLNDLPHTYLQSISGYTKTQYVTQTIQYLN